MDCDSSACDGDCAEFTQDAVDYASYDIPIEAGEAMGGPSSSSILDERTMADRAIDFRMNAPPSGLMERPTGRTGPKGVKEDFEEAKRNLRNIRLRESLARERAIQQKVAVKVELKAADNKAALSEDEDEDEDDEEDEAFARYRQSALASLATFQNGLPTFGSYEKLESKGEFADLVKAVHESVYVVCHVYENNIVACARLHFSLEELAKQFDHVKFVRIRAAVAMPNYAASGLPTFLVYRGGQLLSSAIRVTDALPAAFSDVDVARLLQAKNILTVPTGLEEKLKKRAEWKKKNQLDNEQQFADADKPIVKAQRQPQLLDGDDDD